VRTVGEAYKENMEELFIRDDFIKLGQALKLAGFVESGVEAKEVIQEGLVKVNGEVDTRRGKKLVVDDEVHFGSHSFIVKKK